MRKRCHRRPIKPMPPPGLRPRLARHQVLDLGLAHIENLDRIARGAADWGLMFQWIGGALTWSHATDLLQQRDADRYRPAAEAMRAQLEVCHAVIDRYVRTGRVGFSGPEYQVARDAVEWMDALAEVIDLPTAEAAADWGDARVNELAARVQPRESTT